MVMVSTAALLLMGVAALATFYSPGSEVAHAPEENTPTLRGPFGDVSRGGRFMPSRGRRWSLSRCTAVVLSGHHSRQVDPWLASKLIVYALEAACRCAEADCVWCWGGWLQVDYKHKSKKEKDKPAKEVPEKGGKGPVHAHKKPAEPDDSDDDDSSPAPAPKKHTPVHPSAAAGGKGSSSSKPSPAPPAKKTPSPAPLPTSWPSHCRNCTYSECQVRPPSLASNTNMSRHTPTTCSCAKEQASSAARAVRGWGLAECGSG